MVSHKGILLGALIVVFTISGCGGGGGGSAPSASVPPPGSGSGITSYLVDGPTRGVNYLCTPSGSAGVTQSNGAFTCNAGDSAEFTLGAGASTIRFGAIIVPNVSGFSLPVNMFANGMQVAEILQALNHGSSADIDVSGLNIPPALATEINNYIAGAGVLPNGQGSDDQFLAHVQQQVGSPAPYANVVSGVGVTFRNDVVLPHLQDTIVAISKTNPALPKAATTRLAGSILVSGSGTFPPVAGCSGGNWHASGGGILNATVSGNVQTPGNYQVNFSSPGFLETITIGAFTCTAGGVDFTEPESTTSSALPPLNGNASMTVSSAFTGNAITVQGAGAPVAGCTVGPFSGADVGLSNPMITLSATVSCVVQGVAATVVVTAKLVGAP